MRPLRPEILPPARPLPRRKRPGGRIFIVVSISICILGLCIFVALHSLSGNSTPAAAAQANTYYLSPSGRDSNDGLSANTSWLSPNHALKCGDVIVAAASSAYSASNFYTGKWGTVSCPEGNNVAWIKCQTFDSCTIKTDTNQGMWIDQSYWGVQGWEVTTSASDAYGTCFMAQPNYDIPTEVHHVIFANDIANGCSQGGFTTVNHGAVGVDYVAIVGSIAYNAAQGSTSCASGISIYQPIKSDDSPGTHIYVAGNFSYGNLDPSKCNGGSPTGGAGIVFGSFDGSLGSGSPYLPQVVAYNNITVNNGSKGLEVNNNSASVSHAMIWLTQNTSWGNLTDPHQAWFGCAEVSIYKTSNTHVYGNLVSTSDATGCSEHPIYALAVSSGDASDSVTNNLAYGYKGNHTFLYDSGSFTWGSGNQFGTTPGFTNPVAPGPPACSGTSNVPECMATVIEDFTPKTASAITLGYHKPGLASERDALFPKWLCTANVPSGLITRSCE